MIAFGLSVPIVEEETSQCLYVPWIPVTMLTLYAQLVSVKVDILHTILHFWI